MSIQRRQTQFRHTSSMNIFVLLMTLFLVNGHCSAAYASSSLMPQPTEQAYAASDATELASMPVSHSAMATADVATMLDPYSAMATDCPNLHTDDPKSSLLSLSLQQLRDQQDDAKPLLASINARPEPRAGPCRQELEPQSADFITPPLFYTLCVLRL